jgi:tetratricopeptide (TPR) repeat protein
MSKIAASVTGLGVTFCLANSIFFLASGFQAPEAQGPAAQQPTKTKTRMQGLEEDLASARAQIEKSPKLPEPYKLAGMTLDLMGRFPEARASFTRLIDLSKFGEPKAAAYRVMAISYAFSGDCKGAETWESLAFAALMGEEMFYDAAETATELGRICLESGDNDRALKWYRRGYDTGMMEPGISQDRADLWDFRWEHAQARMAVRRGKIAEAQKHVKEAKAILRKGTNPTQAEYLPYLTGYVALYSGDYQTALSELLKGNQDDVFIECLLGQTQEKLGNHQAAAEYFRQVSSTILHTLPAALALHYVQTQAH